MGGEPGKQRSDLPDAVELLSQPADQRAVAHRHHQRSPSDGGQPSEKQQRQRHRYQQAGEIKQRLEPGQRHGVFLADPFHEEVVHLRIQIGFVKQGNGQGGEQHPAHK